TGIQIVGNGSLNNVVEGNYVGTTADGMSALGNIVNGVWISSGAKNNLVGGTLPGARNVLSGNLQEGAEVQGSTAMGNVIQGNWVGLAADGKTPLGNDTGIILQ